MDSNVTKNTFLYKFLKLDFANNKLGFKQVLLQQLLQVIYLYRQQNKIRDSWDSTIISLSDKIILRNINQHKIATESIFGQSFFLHSWVYRCAIAFPLANYCGIEPLEMAQELVSFFPELSFDRVSQSHIKVMIKIVLPGWIDFKINHDFLGIWLQQLSLELLLAPSYTIDTQTCYKSSHLITEIPNLFPINYYYSRCCSLLKLGEREGLIKLDNHNFQSLTWKISKPNPILWFDVTETFLLTHPQELDLLHSILSILDLFGDRTHHMEVKIWVNSGLNLGQALEKFIMACGFCGEVKHQNPALAIARLGLIALVQWCLLKLLQEKLQVNPIPLANF